MKTKLWITVALLLVAPAAAEDDPRLRGLTIIQKRQVADPGNPQFTAPWHATPTAAVDDDQTPYRFPDVPDEATKVWALKRAFQLNGNSMVGNNRMVDVSGETPFANPVVTERVTVTIPAPAPSPEAQLAKLASVTDTCTRHGLRKVTIRGGKSWRCK